MTWERIPSQYPQFQLGTWRNRLSGETLILERHNFSPREDDDCYDVLLFGLDYPANREPKEVLCNQSSSLQEAARSAREFMRDE